MKSIKYSFLVLSVFFFFGCSNDDSLLPDPSSDSIQEPAALSELPSDTLDSTETTVDPIQGDSLDTMEVDGTTTSQDTTTNTDLTENDEPIFILEETDAIENERIEETISTDPITTNIAITTLDLDGNPLPNVSLDITGGTYESDENGVILIDGITVPEEYLLITASKSGYENNYKTITPSTNGMTLVNIQLQDDVPEQVFMAAVGGVVTYDDVEIDFPTGAITTADGTPYNGMVSVNLVYHNPESENLLQTMPGQLTGIGIDDEIHSLRTGGMITVDITDANGNELQIAEGQRTLVRMPASDNTEATAPIWHFNETHGLWVETTAAVKNGDFYEFEVTHFSSYNIDWYYGGDVLNEVCFRLTENDGSTLANQNVIVKNNGDYLINVQTDNTGSFCLWNTPAGLYSLEIDYYCGNTLDIGTQNVSASTTYEKPVDWQNAQSAIAKVDMSGNFYGCDDDLAFGRSFYLKFNANGEDRFIYDWAGWNGQYDINSLLCNVPAGIYNAEVHVSNQSQDQVEVIQIDLSSAQEIQLDLTGCNETTSVIDLPAEEEPIDSVQIDPPFIDTVDVVAEEPVLVMEPVITGGIFDDFSSSGTMNGVFWQPDGTGYYNYDRDLVVPGQGMTINIMNPGSTEEVDSPVAFFGSIALNFGDTNGDGTGLPITADISSLSSLSYTVENTAETPLLVIAQVIDIDQNVIEFLNPDYNPWAGSGYSFGEPVTKFEITIPAGETATFQGNLTNALLLDPSLANPYTCATGLNDCPIVVNSDDINPESGQRYFDFSRVTGVQFFMASPASQDCGFNPCGFTGTAILHNFELGL